MSGFPERRTASDAWRWLACLCIAQLTACALDEDALSGTADPSLAPDGGLPLDGGGYPEAGAFLDGGVTGDAGWPGSTADAAVQRDGGGGNGCALGAAGSFATDAQLDLFGDTVYFARGQELPAGRYRVTYADGCMKFNVLQPWTVNQNIGVGTDGWYLVGASKSDRVVLLPGTDIIVPFAGYGDFASCVAANRQLPPKEFDFKGGKLGVYLNDAPYTDNLSGEGGRNPKWELTLLVDECPPGLVLL